jgi:hypothetical protein
MGERIWFPRYQDVSLEVLTMPCRLIFNNKIVEALLNVFLGG